MADMKATEVRPFIELADAGLLWLINRTVFHPRGFALQLARTEDREAVGWVLVGDGTTPWRMDAPEPEFDAAEATLAAARADPLPR